MRKIHKHKIYSMLIIVALLIQMVSAHLFATDGLVNFSPFDSVCGCGDTHEEYSGYTALSTYSDSTDDSITTSWTGGSLVSGAYYLDADMTLTESIVVGADETVVLCLNGHVLSAAGIVEGSVILLEEGATLSIYDADTEADTGIVTNTVHYGSWEEDIAGDSTSYELLESLSTDADEDDYTTITGGVITSATAGSAVISATTGSAVTALEDTDSTIDDTVTTLNLYGGTIAGNICGDAGVIDYSGVTVNIAGNITIIDNIDAEGNENNLLIDSENPIGVQGDISASQIAISATVGTVVQGVEQPLEADSGESTTYDLTEEDVKAFTYTLDGYELVLDKEANTINLKEIVPFVAVTDLEMTSASSVEVNTDLTLEATVTPADATNQTIVWSIATSDDGSTGASVAEGVLKTTSASAGTVIVTATIEDGTSDGTDYAKNFEITITDSTVDDVVIEPVTDIAMTSASSVEINTALTLAATVTPADATNQEIVWSIAASDDGSTGASVVEGVFTATSAGTAIVTATIEDGIDADIDYTENFVITVTETVPTVTSVIIDPTQISVQKGNTYQFTSTVKGTNDPVQTVTWSVSGASSSNTTIVNGLLNIASGETATKLTVTATSTQDTSKSASATVTVTSPATVTETIIYRFDLVTNGEGTISPDGGEYHVLYVDPLVNQTFTFTPAEGYYIESIWFDGVNYGQISTFTFDLVDGNHTIIANFEVIPEETVETTVAPSTSNTESDLKEPEDEAVEESEEETESESETEESQDELQGDDEEEEDTTSTSTTKTEVSEQLFWWIIAGIVLGLAVIAGLLILIHKHKANPYEGYLDGEESETVKEESN